MDYNALYKAAALSWSAETSFNEDWEEAVENGVSSSYGQCAVTTLWLSKRVNSLIVTPLDIKSAIVKYDGKEAMHYWLWTIHGDIDFTWDQFPPYAVKQILDAQVPVEHFTLNNWMKGRADLFARRADEWLRRMEEEGW